MIDYADKDVLPEQIRPEDVRVTVSGAYLKALRAENARLRAALELIAEGPPEGWVEVARNALAQSTLSEHCGNSHKSQTKNEGEPK